MGQKMRLQFESSVDRIQEIKAANHSFDAGVLRVCYPGRNRNDSFISKDSIERAVPTMFNCPIVCNYDLETDSIGGHDMELAEDAEGKKRIINLTEPVGVVPAGSNWWWEKFNGKDYFTIEVILWKRSTAYSKIAKDGVVAHSMEIDVDNGRMENGLFEIKDFTFTAFCLLGDDKRPCFEDSALELFDRDHARISFAQMMAEYKQLFTMSQPDQVVINQNYSEGGDEVLEQKIELLAKYGLTAEQFEADLDAMTYEELEAEMRKRFDEEPEQEPGDASGGNDEPGGESGESGDSGDDPIDPEPEPEPDPEPEDDGDDDTAKKNGSFELAGQVRDELCEAFAGQTIDGPWGPMPKYWMIDYDPTLGEVYVEDSEDWKIYGFKYTMNGDAVVIDFESKTRKKYAIVDFDEGEQSAMFEAVVEFAAGKFNELKTANAETQAQFDSASEEMKQMKAELETLRQFKAEADDAEARAEREEVLSQFAELEGIEEFEALCENCMEFSVEDLEEKCFALRGKNMMKGNFSLNIGAPKVKIGKYEKPADDPYGGLFAKYGNNED